MGKYLHSGQWYTIQELSQVSGIKCHTLRDRLRRGYSVEEAVKVLPVHNSVKAFCDASWYQDWIGMPINDLYEIYFRWCISQGYEYIEVTKQGFSRQLFTIYPNLKTVPTKRGDRCYRIIRERS